MNVTARRLVTFIPAAAVVAAALAFAAPPATAAPTTLNFSIDPGQEPASGITLGAPNGEQSCSGEGDAMVCNQPMGISTSYSIDASITEVGTGVKGRLDGTCTVMYAGITTTYVGRTGSSNATGSEDCDLHFTFGPGDEAWGGMHQARVLADNTETSTFTITITRGTGKFQGLSGQIVMQDSQQWTPPEPIDPGKFGGGCGNGGSGGGGTGSVGPRASGGGDPCQGGNDCTDPNGCKGGDNGGGTCTDPNGCNGGDNGGGTCTDPNGCTGGGGGGTCTDPNGCTGGGGGGGGGGSVSPAAHPQALTLLARAAAIARPSADNPGMPGIPLSTKPLVDVTSMGLLAPVNASAKVVVAAAAGSSCKGTMTAGKKVIALPAKKVPASAGSVTLKSFPSGSLKGVAAWKLNVVCTLKGKSTTTVRNLKTFEVVPNAKT